MEFRVLGPVEIAAGRELIDVGGRQRLTLLMVLLVHAGAIVSTDQLVDELWGEDPPERARRTVQAHVAHLRKLLNRDKEVLKPVRSGYVLHVGSEEVDARVFE